MNETRCIVCDEIIPEGRQVCPNCNKSLEVVEKQFTEYLKSIVTGKNVEKCVTAKTLFEEFVEAQNE